MKDSFKLNSTCCPAQALLSLESEWLGATLVTFDIQLCGNHLELGFHSLDIKLCGSLPS